MTKNKTLKVLKDLKKLFRTDRRWLKGRLYLSSKDSKPLRFSGKVIDVFPDEPHEKVDKVCIVGGIGVVCHGVPFAWNKGLREESSSIARALGFTSVDEMVNWNNSDFTSHKDFLNRIKMGINRLQKDVKESGVI